MPPIITNSAESLTNTVNLTLASDATMLLAWYTSGRGVEAMGSAVWSSDAEALTQLLAVNDTDDNDGRSELWFLHDPKLGAHVLTFSSDPGTQNNWFAIGVKGVDTDDPWRTQFTTNGTISPAVQLDVSLSPAANDLQIGSMSTWRASEPIPGDTDSTTSTDTYSVVGATYGAVLARNGIGNLSFNTGNASVENDFTVAAVSIKPTPVVSTDVSNAIFFGIAI